MRARCRRVRPAGPSAASSSARHSSMPGASETAAGYRSLRTGSKARSPGGTAAEGKVGAGRAPEVVPGTEHRRGAQLHRGHDDRQRIAGDGRDRGHDLSPAGDQGGAADDAERHVGPDSGGEFGGEPSRGLEQPAGQVEGGGGVGTAPSEPGRNRDPLVEPNGQRPGVPDPVADRFHRPPHAVVLTVDRRPRRPTP